MGRRARAATISCGQRRRTAHARAARRTLRPQLKDPSRVVISSRGGVGDAKRQPAKLRLERAGYVGSYVHTASGNRAEREIREYAT